MIDKLIRHKSTDWMAVSDDNQRLYCFTVDTDFDRGYSVVRATNPPFNFVPVMNMWDNDYKTALYNAHNFKFGINNMDDVSIYEISPVDENPNAVYQALEPLVTELFGTIVTLG